MPVRLRAAVVTAAALLSGTAWATHQSTTLALSLSNTQDLSFGRFAAGSGGSVTVTPSGARSSSGGVVLLSTSSGTPAKFTVSGDLNATYNIELPADGTVTLRSSSGHSLPVNGFTSSPATTGQLNGLGSQTLSIGATLQVSPSQPAGDYTGTFDLTVNYN